MFELSHLTKLREEMKKNGLAGYLILTSDPHNSEEPASYFASERRYFCPFTGDNAYVLVTEDEALLWTDGRFFIAAEKELEGSSFRLMKLGTPGFDSPEEYMKNHTISPVGTDFTLLMQSGLSSYTKATDLKDISFSSLVETRTPLCEAPLWKFDDPKYNDLTREEKCAKVMEEVKKSGASAHLISTLDDIAYLMNLRGNDIHCTPLFYSYLYLEENAVHLFVNTKRIGFDLPGVTLHEYDEIDAFLAEHSSTPTLVDSSSTNAHVYAILQNPVEGDMPSRLLKAVKGPKEIENITSIQEEDGVAMLKFIAYLDEHRGEATDEWQLAEELLKYRKEGKRFLDLSFPTIAAVGPNAAMMHYGPSENVHSPVNKDSLQLLVDSGGQYFGGTTDTTRTFLIGKPTEEFIHDYTLSLKSVIALSSCRFIAGSTGRPIDMMARSIMWNEGLDYKCGTGHGVGYLSVVHEGPNGFRYRGARGKNDGCAIVPGMITTIEPGVYKQDKYGIRIENDILCVPFMETPDGTFYQFKNLTFVPIETTALDLSMMTKEEIRYLNDFHKDVYEHLYPWVKDDARLLKVLKEKTKAI